MPVKSNIPIGGKVNTDSDLKMNQLFGMFPLQKIFLLVMANDNRNK